MQKIKVYLISGLGGITISIIAYVLITYFIEPMRFSFSYGFPPVGGNYLVSYPDHPDWKTEPVKVHQIGFYIKGDFNTPQDNESYEFTGNVTASRIISYQFRPKNTRLNEYGAGLIKMNQNGKEGDGYVLFLSEENERPVPVKLVIKLIPDK